MNTHGLNRSLTVSPKAYSIKDLVSELRIGRTMIYQLIKEKRLKTIKIGDRTLVTAEDLDSFLINLRTSQ